MADPILAITDGTTRISLIAPSLFKLRDWTPVRPALKGGGVWRGSPLSDGNDLVNAQYHNIVDTFSLVANEGCQDELIRLRQDLDRLLIKARQYWTTDWQSEPVWIEARGPYESNLRYSVIHSYDMPMDDNPYGPQFGNGEPAMEDLTLSLEHGFWLAEEPGTSTCVEVAAYQGVESVEEIYYPVVGADDAYVDRTASLMFLGASRVSFGKTTFGNRVDGGWRFNTVTIPQGATITSAFIRGTCETGYATFCSVEIIGEDNATPAVFSTYADFIGRIRTSISVPWQPGAEVVGVVYDTPDISDVVQAIVDRGDWANGNNMVLFIQEVNSVNNGRREWASVENITYPPAELHITYLVAMGREATCLPENYVANKHNMAQLSDVYTWTSPGGPFSANLIGGALPQDLFDGGVAGPSNGDITYFGINTVPADTGPFCSLVFDILTAATYGAGDFVTWQYWNGGWVNLTVWDNTANPASSGVTSTPFENTGVNSVHWEQPTDWATTAVNGVTGYWVRIVVTEVTGITRAQQQNRDIYTVTWPYVDIDSDTVAGTEQLGGDIPALALLTNYGCAEAAVNVAVNRVLWGLRSKSRGANFTAYLNLADEQNQAGITVTPSGSTAFANNTGSATGRVCQYSVAGVVASALQAQVAWSSALAPEWYGTFRAFVRYWTASGVDGDVRFYLAAFSGGSEYQSSSVPALVQSQWVSADMGQVKLPLGPHPGVIEQFYMYLELYVECLAAGAHVVDFMDIILIPTDEWAMDCVKDNVYIYASDKFVLDSVTRPKYQLTGWTLDQTTGVLQYIWPIYSTGPAILQANADQRLWCHMGGYNAGIALTEKIYPPHDALRVELDSVHRYLNMRGDR